MKSAFLFKNHPIRNKIWIDELVFVWNICIISVFFIECVYFFATRTKVNVHFHLWIWVILLWLSQSNVIFYLIVVLTIYGHECIEFRFVIAVFLRYCIFFTRKVSKNGLLWKWLDLDKGKTDYNKTNFSHNERFWFICCWS